MNLTDEDQKAIRHMFIMRGVNLTKIVEAKWEDHSKTPLAAQLTPNWLGKKLGLADKVVERRPADIRAYSTKFILDGVHVMEVSVVEDKLLAITGRLRRGLFYNKQVDELVRPSPKALEYQIWDYILAELTNIEEHITQLKRRGLDEARANAEGFTK